MKTSIATKHGDTGQTALAGGVRVSKSSIRVEAYGTIDELNSCLGFARSICADREICDTTRQIQKELFHIGSALATPPSFRKNDPPMTEQMVDALASQVHKIEAIEGVLSDWSIPGEHSAAAAYDVGRTVCRRAEMKSDSHDRGRGGDQPIRGAVFESAFRSAMALWKTARVSRRTECGASR